MDPHSQLSQADKMDRGASDAGRYFRYMTEFVGFTPEDGRAIRQTALVIEKHIPGIVADFYAHLLRYPPTRKHFLAKDGSVDQDYLQKRMAHLANFWRRTASGEYDDEYARYIDYVGLAHTNRGADPNIYIAERYVIGQVGFMQHAISAAISKELHEFDPDLEVRGIRAWNKLMMVILELLARAYGYEHEAENFERHPNVNDSAVKELAVQAYEQGLGLLRPRPLTTVAVAREAEIPSGERKLVEVEGISIGVFHHRDGWYAVRNHCVHRGGPVATGRLEGDTLVCPWHGYRYDVTTGALLVDPTIKLEIFPVIVHDGMVYLQVAERAPAAQFQFEHAAPEPAPVAAAGTAVILAENQFLAASLLPGRSLRVRVEGHPVAVFNVDGAFYAIDDECSHEGGPLSEGDLNGNIVECPWHASCFDVTTGAVTCPPARHPVQAYRVTLAEGIGTVEK